MNTDEFKLRAGHVKQLAETGEKIISSFRAYINENLSGEFTIIEHFSPYRLRASFYGLALLVQVELRLRTSGGDGVIAAYRLSYGHEPKEISLNVRYKFDKLGNVEKEKESHRLVHPYDECAPHFFAEVFTQLATQDEIILRP